jgi:hypothetical protein
MPSTAGRQAGRFVSGVRDEQEDTAAHNPPAIGQAKGLHSVCPAFKRVTQQSCLTMRQWKVAMVPAMAALTAGSWMSAAASVTCSTSSSSSWCGHVSGYARKSPDCCLLQDCSRSQAASAAS